VGPKKFIEFHVVLRGVQGFIEAHDLTEQLIRRIRSKFSNSVVTVHSDPEGVVEPDMD
jgi:divalent metal cation (Fe/Co/Zn/Cd) transporter